MIQIAPFEQRRKGDLFTDRMADLVHAIGFDVESVNLHRTGRELDIIAVHRIEKRRAVVECKAQGDPIGGSDISKFVGVLDAERRRHPDVPVAGYFVSLSGFTAPAVEQEREFDNSRCSLLGPSEVASELVASRIVAPAARAVAAAAAAISDGSLPGIEPELLATEYGWVWSVNILRQGVPRAVCFVHADGHILAESQARPLMQVATGEESLELVCNPGNESVSLELRTSYLDYLQRDLGTVTHEGLPADSQISAGVDLEKLYVPLRLEEWKDDEVASALNAINTGPHPKEISVGEALESNLHISIVGAPGCGKSTLLNRTALAYATDDRDFIRSANLLEAELLPVLLRCRNVPTSGASALQAVRGLVEQFGKTGTGQQFEAVVISALREGKALILVDGLDEITSTATRIAFVRSVRNLVATYPANRLIVTSREPGFRPVAGALAEYGARFRVSDMDNKSIRMLVERWNDLIPRRTTNRLNRDLASQIIQNSRIRLLASTPLLLTTLLLVERWVGDLPRRRTVLYDKAIEVLLMTWNVEGHEPLNLDEVLPQLAYVAHEMTSMGVQQLSASSLIDLLAKARHDMPDVLGYIRSNPRELLDRIESRSSLLSQAGYTVEDGRLQPNFEFRHLTFQEYLTALACVKGWTAGEITTTTEAALSPHFGDQAWFEVVPLAAVLSGRSATLIIESMLTYVEDLLEADRLRDDADMDEWQKLQDVIAVLVDCLLDEAACRPDVARRAITLAIEMGTIDGFMNEHFVEAMLAGKFGDDLRSVVDKGVAEGGHFGVDHASVAGQILQHDLEVLTLDEGVLAEKLLSMLSGESRQNALASMGLLLHYAYLVSQNDLSEYPNEFVDELDLTLSQCQYPMISVYTEANSSDSMYVGLAAWTLAWMLHDIEIAKEDKQRLLDQSLKIVFQDKPHRNSDFSCWLISQNCLEPRGTLQVNLTDAQEKNISLALDTRPETAEGLGHSGRAAFALLYMSGKRSDADLKALVQEFQEAATPRNHPDRVFFSKLPFVGGGLSDG